MMYEMLRDIMSLFGIKESFVINADEQPFARFKWLGKWYTLTIEEYNASK